MQYINYRYRNFHNQSFQEELQTGNNTVDFTGARLIGCNFQNTSLIDADFSSTEIKRDQQKINSEIIQLVLHILWGIPIGWLAWQTNYISFGCGVSPASANLYTWLTNPLWIVGFGSAAAISSRWMFLALLGLISLFVIISIILKPVAIVLGIILLVAAFVATLIGMYLGFRKGSIAVGMIWTAVGVSSAISAGASWLRYQEIHFAALFAILTLLPATLATQAFSKHFAKATAVFMTSFNGANLTNARFSNAALENCDFTKANLTNVDWTGTTFKNCKFPRNWTKNSHGDDNQAIAPQLEYNPVLEKL